MNHVSGICQAICPICPILAVFPICSRVQEPKPAPMATSTEIQQRHSVIRGWLETGASHATVATMICARFGLSRSTAYEDIKKVQPLIDECDDGPSTAELEEPDLNGVLGMLQHQFNIAAATGDVPAMTKLVGAIDKAKRWHGRTTTLQGSASSGYV
jgi:hypothetical protein